MLIKVLIDQLIVAVFLNVLFFVTVSLLQDCNHPLNRAWNTIRTNLFHTMKVNWCIWPIVQMANFFFIPVEYQTLICNCVSFFWSMFLSFMGFQKEKELPTKKPTPASQSDTCQDLNRSEATPSSTQEPQQSLSI